MSIEPLRRPKGAITAIVLLIAGLAVAWLCLREAVIRALPADSALVRVMAPTDPDVVLSAYMAQLPGLGGRLSAQGLAAVRAAAVGAPLDARPYYLVGRQAPLGQMVPILEAGQRLAPRDRLIHVYLLERYLLTGRYRESAVQLGVLSRLVGAATVPIAKALMLMTANPAIRPDAQQTLRNDPRLENTVLAMLAKSDTDPAQIFGLASADGLAHAGDPGGWGQALIARLIAEGHYMAAHRIWQRIWHVDAAAAQQPIYDPRFADTSAAPPFGWTFAASSLGAADSGKGGLAVDYYGRDSGDLASQMLLLAPGRYRFFFTVEGGAANVESKLIWELTCASDATAKLFSAAVPATTTTVRQTIEFTIPGDCPAQTLRLRGQAGEFPDQIHTTIRDVAIRAADGTAGAAQRNGPNQAAGT